MSETALLTRLTQACEGLLWVSETEAELTPFEWQDCSGSLSEATIRNKASIAADTDVETMSLPDFFRSVPDENRDSFEALSRVLTGELREITVYKFGKVKLKVWLVGRTSAGHWAGFATEAVET